MYAFSNDLHFGVGRMGHSDVHLAEGLVWRETLRVGHWRCSGRRKRGVEGASRKSTVTRSARLESEVDRVSESCGDRRSTGRPTRRCAELQRRFLSASRPRGLASNISVERLCEPGMRNDRMRHAESCRFEAKRTRKAMDDSLPALPMCFFGAGVRRLFLFAVKDSAVGP